MSMSATRRLCSERVFISNSLRSSWVVQASAPRGQTLQHSRGTAVKRPAVALNRKLSNRQFSSQTTKMGITELKNRKRSDYKFHLEYRTRWSDNDMYDHMNNSIYYFLYDSIVNSYLIKHCGLHPPTAKEVGLVVHSSSDYFGSVGFPDVIDLGLRVNKLGKSSVTYEIGVFAQGVEEVKAVGGFIHVFVDRAANRPSAEGMSSTMREGLNRILVQDTAKM